MRVELVGGPRDGDVRPLDLRDEITVEVPVRNAAGGMRREQHTYHRTQRATAGGSLAYEYAGRVAA